LDIEEIPFETRSDLRGKSRDLLKPAAVTVPEPGFASDVWHQQWSAATVTWFKLGGKMHMAWHGQLSFAIWFTI